MHHLLFTSFLAVIGALRMMAPSAQELVTIKGKIRSAEDKQPLKFILVTIREGEEEALTTKDGSFSIRTYHKIPVTITCSHPDYKTVRITCNDAEEPLIVQMEKSK